MSSFYAHRSQKCTKTVIQAAFWAFGICVCKICMLMKSTSDRLSQNNNFVFKSLLRKLRYSYHVWIRYLEKLNLIFWLDFWLKSILLLPSSHKTCRTHQKWSKNYHLPSFTTVRSKIQIPYVEMINVRTFSLKLWSTNGKE